MASLKDLRLRIDSVKNTQQITRAMKMVSAAKLRKAQANIVNLRPYANKIRTVIADIAATHRVEHPLLNQNKEVKKALLVVLTSDRGLCGAFNSNINKFALNFYRENSGKYEQLDFLLIGRKANDFFKNRGIKPVEVIQNLAREVSYKMAARQAEKLMNAFTDGAYDQILLVYNEFKSAISQNVVCENLLPISLDSSEFSGGEDNRFAKDMIFEPAPEEMINELLNKHFAIQVYRCMCESVAAEHGARMAAMENATKNAGEMISAMTLNYNKMRQASITTELIEITSGAEALNG